MRLRARIAFTTVAVSLPMVVSLMVLDAVASHRASRKELATFAASMAAHVAQEAGCTDAPARDGRTFPPEGGLAPPMPGPGAQHGPPPPPPPLGFDAPAPPPPGEAGPPGPRPSFGPARAPHGPPPAAPALRPRPHRRPARFVVLDASFAPWDPAFERPANAASRLAAADALDVATPLFGDTVAVLLPLPEPTTRCRYVLATGTTEPWLGGFLPNSPLWLLPLVGVAFAVVLTAGPIARRLRRLAAQMEASARADYATTVELVGEHEDEVTDVARAFDAAARTARERLAQIERSEAALREFLANTTHDVMIPLTVLQGHLAELEAELPDTRARAMLSDAMREAHHLGALIQDLATTATLDASAARPTRVRLDLGALVERVVARHRPIARQLGVHLEHGIPRAEVGFEGDVTWLEQAVGNLVLNALRYNERDGHVAVLLDEHGPDRFALTVVDDGPGLSDEDLAKITERGFRGAGASRRAPAGSGLGLDIARRVAEAHGLALHFVRAGERGLEARLEGPRIRTAAPSEAPRSSQPPG